MVRFVRRIDKYFFTLYHLYQTSLSKYNLYQYIIIIKYKYRYICTSF